MYMIRSHSLLLLFALRECCVTAVCLFPDLNTFANTGSDFSAPIEQMRAIGAEHS